LPPNSSSATAPNNIQCQMLKLPMIAIPSVKTNAPAFPRARQPLSLKRT
jgi:hypothetical protein